MTGRTGSGSLPAGKLPADLLAALLGELPAPPSDVIVGAQPGEDAAVVDVGGRYLVLAMDPITLSSEPGRFAVQVNANDIAVMGAEPRWLLASILLPHGSTEADARAVMEQLHGTCGSLGVALIGGHTEISPAVSQTVVTACMVGEVAADRLVTSAGAQPGDALLLAGPIAVEGTAILAREFAGILRERGTEEYVIREAARLLDHPGVSVLPAARAMTSVALPHAMHDPTEGGLLSAIREMATASAVGVRIEVDQVPVLPVCGAICSALHLDPLKLLASGSLLAAVSPGDVPAVRDALVEAGIPWARLGEVVAKGDGMTLMRAGVGEPLSVVDRDELARWIEGLE